ncbi:MAG: T9SS type A sorting domain-containing protein, partial [Flavobacteriales bacterium]
TLENITCDMVYNSHFTSQEGLDSLVVNTLIVGVNTGTEIVEACDSFTWIDGITYTEDNSDATFNIVGGSVGGCDSLVTLNLTFSAPSPVFTSTNGILASSLDNAEYQWLDCDDGNEPIEGATDQSYAVTWTGNYALEVTENGCSSTSDCMEVLTVGVTDKNVNNALHLYPNPTKGDVFIEFGQAQEKVEITLLDLTGRIISTEQLYNKTTLQFAIEEPVGTYFLRVNSASVNSVIQVIKVAD